MVLVGKVLGPGFAMPVRASAPAAPRWAGGATRAGGAVSCAALSLPRSLASTSVSRNRPASWVVKALVEATPISGPARVRNSAWTGGSSRFPARCRSPAYARGPSFLGVVQRGQSIGGFAGLRNGDHQRVGIGHAGRGNDIRWRFPRCRECRRSLPASSAPPARHGGWCRRRESGCCRPVRMHLAASAPKMPGTSDWLLHTFQRVRQGLRLLVNFLLHVVLVFAQLACSCCQFADVHRTFHRLALAHRKSGSRAGSLRPHRLLPDTPRFSSPAAALTHPTR